MKSINRTQRTKDLKEKSILVSRAFNAPTEKVWKAHTDNEILDQWWGPSPWKAETKTINFLAPFRNIGVTLYHIKLQMNKFKLVAIFFTCFFLLTGCDGDKDSGPEITSLKLNLSKNRIVGDSTDYAKISVTSQDGNSVLELVTIYYKGFQLSSDKIKSATPSVSSVYAIYNNIKSNEEEIEVVADVKLKFVKYVLIEQYTGTWCGWCPRAIYQINNLHKTDSQFIHIAYHLSDEMAYNLNGTLFQSFGFTGIPTVHADRNLVWQGEVSEIAELNSPPRVGISMEVSGDPSSISASINIKFGYDFDEQLRMSVYLIHDSLIASQANYYDTDPTSPFFKAGATMTDFVHRNVMIKSGTDMFGDLIPSSSVDIGSTYTREIVFTGFRCDDIRDMVIAAFITYGNGNKSGQVMNASGARVGQKLEFNYSDD